MKLETLKKALEHYVLTADCSAEDRPDVFDAIAECNELAERYINRELWKDCIYLISADSLSDLLNMTTYDDFGKRAKIHGNDVPFDYYASDVRKWYLQDLTNRSLQLGYDIIHDLWHDNEVDGNHNPDGTFYRGFGTLTTDDISLIRDVLCEKLDDLGSGTKYESAISILEKIANR